MVITFVGMVVSATTAELQSGPAAMETMVISHKKILPLFAITAAMLLLTVLISAPQEIIQRFVALPFVENNPFVMYAAEVWQSLTSVILLTFSLAPICEYLRSKPQ
jgi:hypothetical protein